MKTPESQLVQRQKRKKLIDHNNGDIVAKSMSTGNIEELAALDDFLF
jgi:hypothetical protein